MLEQQVSRLMGVTVRIGAIVARSNGLIPSLELADVRMLDAQGREALKLPSVLAALSARSILSLGLEQLTIESPELDVRRSKDGRIWVAGLLIHSGDNADSAGADWIFSQPELVIRHGTVTWTDEVRAVPSLALTEVDWILRNQHNTHSMRLDATPPEHWGTRLSVSGIFKQPLLSRRASLWREWQGQLFANFLQIDLAQLRRYADLGVDLAQGSGSVRAWVDVDRGEFTGATADLALDDVTLTVNPKLEALALRGVTGRLGAKTLDGGVSFRPRQYSLKHGTVCIGQAAMCEYRLLLVMPESQLTARSWVIGWTWLPWRRLPGACRWTMHCGKPCCNWPQRGWLSRCKAVGKDRWRIQVVTRSRDAANK